MVKKELEMIEDDVAEAQEDIDQLEILIEQEERLLILLIITFKIEKE